MLYAAPLPANTLQGMMQLYCAALCDDGDAIFYSQRVFDLFPQMATAQSGWDTHNHNGSNVFGSEVITDSTNDSDYIEWAVNVPAGNYKVKVLHQTANNSGIAALSVNGGATISSLDHYSSPTVNNVIWTSAEFALPEGSNTIRFTKNGKHASSSNYFMRFQHVQLIKQDADSALTNANNAPKIIDIPVMLADSHINWNTVSGGTGYKFGIRRQSSGAQNDSVTYSFWAPAGNFTLALLYGGSDWFAGIFSISVDGNSIGTIDGLTKPANTLDTSLSGTLAYTGQHSITFTMATKNASSASYGGTLQHIQIRMTSISAAITRDTAPEIVLLWPYLHGVASSGWTLNMATLYAYYHRYYSSNANTSYIEWNNIVLRPGTYRLDILTATNAQYAKGSIYIDDVDTGLEYDGYGSTVNNVVKTVSGITISDTAPKTLKITNEDRHASATGWYIVFMGAPLRFVRTGD